VLPSRSARALAALALLTGASALAAAPGAVPAGWMAMGSGLFGGLALFLFGMEQMGDALKSVAGTGMRTALTRLTRNRLTAAFAGAAVTAVIQSSSVTTVLVVGFVAAGLMNVTQSIGIIMGANIGTTVTAHIVAFKVTEYALLLVAAGFAMQFFVRDERSRQYGGVIMGLGLIFFGMGIMSDGMAPLREYAPFIEFMRGISQPALALLAGAIFTALIQSSSATTGIVVVLATQGFIALPTGIALALGANIGTCFTAVLASIGKPVEARRAAAVHVLFNVAGALLWLPLIGQLSAIATDLSPAHPELAGAARMAAEVPRQIANANTAFNVINTILFIGFAGSIGRLVKVLVPDRPGAAAAIARPRFLDAELLGTPALALARVRLEIGHMGEHVRAMIDALRPATEHRDLSALRRIVDRDDAVDALADAILEYLARIRSQAGSGEEADSFQRLVNVTGFVENIGDVIESELVPLARRYLDRTVARTPAVAEMVRELGESVDTALAGALQAVVTDDADAARAVLALKPDFEREVRDVLAYQARHLAEAGHDYVKMVQMEMEFLERLRRIFALTRRIAREVLPREEPAPEPA